MFKILITLLLIVGISQANNISDLRNSYDMGNLDSGFKLGKLLKKQKKYEESSQIFVDLMLANYPKSYIELGDIFENALGIERNCEKAATFYIGAVSENICEGYLKLSEMIKNKNCYKVYNSNLESKFLKKYKDCINK